MSTWETIVKEATTAKNRVRICGEVTEPDDGLISSIGITENSTLGAILKYSSGIIVDEGFLRLFGGTGSDDVEPVINWNRIPGFQQIEEIPEGCFLFAYDVLGGFYALNGGTFPGKPGNVYYYAPDTLEWENLETGHLQFISWCFHDDVNSFYGRYQNPELRSLVPHVKAGMGIQVYPFLWTEEGKDIATASRKNVPL